MKRTFYARYSLPLVLAAFLAAGCAHNSTPPAGQAGSPQSSAPAINIVGAWSGTMGPIPITYVFNADGTESVITQQRDGQMSTKGTYTLDGNKLTMHTSSMQAMGQTASEDTGSTHTVSVSGNQLTIQDMGLTLTRRDTASIPPPQPPQPAQAPMPGSSVQTMANGQQYIKGPATIKTYPNGAPDLVPPAPAGPHTIAPPPSSSTQITVGTSSPPQYGANPGGATH